MRTTGENFPVMNIVSAPRVHRQFSDEVVGGQNNIKRRIRTASGTSLRKPARPTQLPGSVKKGRSGVKKRVHQATRWIQV